MKATSLLDISILHKENEKLIEIHVGKDSLLIWFALTADIQRFLTSRSVVAILKQQPQTASRWSTAQAVFNRIAAANGPVSITTDEADTGADLLACMFLAYKESGFSGPWKRSLPEIWAKVARYQFEPLPMITAYGKANAAIRGYEQIRHRIGGHPTWQTLEEVCEFFLILNKYKSKNHHVLALKDRLDAISRMYRLALDAIKP